MARFGRLQEISLNNKEETLNFEKYSFHRDVLESGHCKSECVKMMGKHFGKVILIVS